MEPLKTDPGAYIFLGALTGAFGLKYIYSAVTNSYHGDLRRLHMPISKRIIVMWIGVAMGFIPVIISAYIFGFMAMMQEAGGFWGVSLSGKAFAVMFWSNTLSPLVAIISSVYLVKFGHRLHPYDEQIKQALAARTDNQQ